MKVFLRWWMIFTLSMVAFILCRSYGFTDYCIQEDTSYICIIVFWLYMAQSALCCKSSYLLSVALKHKNTESPKLKQLHKYLIEKVKKQMDLGWFVSEACLNLGLLGTLIGFVLMLKGFKTLDINDPSTSQSLLTQLGKSMATALLTTVTGLVCSNVLKFQYFNLNTEVEKYEV